MSERYEFQPRDAELLWPANVLLRKIITSGAIRPAQLVTVAKLQHVLSVLPRVTEELTASVSVSCPRHKFGDIETFHWWDFGIENGRPSITSGGHFYDPKTGGDTFTTMDWVAGPDEPTELNDYRDTLWMVPDVRSYSEGVESIDLSAEGYKIEILDNNNPQLEEEADDDVEVEADEVQDDTGEAECESEETLQISLFTALEASAEVPASGGRSEAESTRALLDQLFIDSRLYTQSKDYKQLLDFVVRLPNFAPFNAMLLQVQKPGLHFAASAHDWQVRFGRRPKTKARPLLILWPFGPVALVYDELDTEGRDLPRDVRSFYAEGPSGLRDFAR